MQDQNLSLPRTLCPTCGKVTPRRDIRDRKPQYCSRICAGLSKFQTRYKGSGSGPFDRPVDIMTKTKWNPGSTKDIPEGA